MNYKKSFIFSFLTLTILFLAPVSSAHVSVKPQQAGAASFQTFTVGVPVEKDMATVGLRLVIPEGLNRVTPNVKSGWKVEVKKEERTVGMKGEVLNTGEQAPKEEVVTEIIWSGGVIPSGQRDDFLFSAQVPSDEKTLQWKAYQTYADGTVVSWDQEPNAEQPKNEDGHSDFSEKGPLSETKVINDLAGSTANKTVVKTESQNTNAPFVLSALAFLFSSISLGLQFRKKR